LGAESARLIEFAMVLYEPWVPSQHASAMLLIRLDASGLGHAKRLCVFASVPGGTAPRCEAAGKPCKAGKLIHHPSLVCAIAYAGAGASALRLQYPRSADQENLPLVLNSPSVRQGRKRSPPAV